MTETNLDGRTLITAPDAPEAIGPYSHGVVSGGMLFCSGAIPLRPGGQGMVDESVAAETTQCLENLVAVSRAAGTDLSRAVRLTIYTTRLEAFDEINEAYAAFFPSDPPARVTVGVAALAKDIVVEIDAVVAMP